LGFYAVQYDLDGGLYDGADKIDDKTKVKWEDAELLPYGASYNPELMDKEGYDFEAWKISSEGKSTRSDGKLGVASTDKYSDLAKDCMKASVTLSAQWTPLGAPAVPDHPDPDDEDNPGDDKDNPGDDGDNPGDDGDNPGDDENNTGDDEDNPGDDEDNTGGGSTKPTPPDDKGKGDNENTGNTDDKDDTGNTGDTDNTDDTDDDEDIENDEETAGGKDPSVPPRPASPGDSVVPSEDADNVYIEIGEDGTPLGEWHYDEDLGEWIFDEYPPLALLNALGKLPQTGSILPDGTGTYGAPFVILFIGLLSLGAGAMGLGLSAFRKDDCKDKI
jgi:hypothetical protein